MQSKTTEQVYEYNLGKYPNLNYSEPNNVLSILWQTKKKNGNGNISISSIKIVLCAIVWKLRKTEAPDSLIKQYSNIIHELMTDTDINEKNHEYTHGYIPKWSDIIKHREEEKNNNPKNHLILSLYTYNPPRRLKDYVLLKFVDTLADMTDIKFNYYYSITRKFIFNSYKTSKSYNQQIVDVPAVLSDIIDKYITIFKINSGELLLGYNNYLQMNYKLKRLLGCSIDNVRHSFINNEYETYNIPPSDKMEKMASMMGHSLTTHLRYRKS
jgi:hypothetical protein